MSSSQGGAQVTVSLWAPLCVWATKVADVVVPTRFLVILFFMQFVLSFQNDIFIDCGQYNGKGVCCGLSIASVSDLSKGLLYIQKVRTPQSHLCMQS